MNDVTIVGAGIIGLATGRELLLRHPHLRLTILEKEDRVAAHQSGRNSGVIHAGIYYAPGSLKAKLCVEGRRALWDYCRAKGIEYRQVGKLIVATDEDELPRLQALWERGQANGIEGLELLDAAGIRMHEPHCSGIQAIHSPVTGIVDFGDVAQSYARDVREMGGAIQTGRAVTGISQNGGALRIATTLGETETRNVITCGGLYSDRLAKMTGGRNDPKIVPFRGDYLILKPEKRHLVNGNIYPVPDPTFPFLGVHFTPRMNGEVWLGPNAVLAFAREGYSFGTVDLRDLTETLTYSGFLKLAARHFKTGAGEMYRDVVRSAYVSALQRFIPELQVEDVLPGPSGIQAQPVTLDGNLVADFVFEGTENILHVRNASSPAATASLAIGAYIADDAERRFRL
ncbi:MAG TPA: L-2-hydroxyglutarate oxidase [Candidatus Rubrimentiphilum sp.]|nr:L-2-hydroxyglutarate oxidase [Candidatus Rubrimentiphilum sp.]